MKSIRYTAIAMALLLSGSLSCTKSSDPAPVNATTSSILVQGSWKITYFTHNGTVGTANYSGYVFNFDPGGSVAAINGSFVTNGSWSTYNDDSQNKLFLNFGTAPPPLDALKHDWHIIEKTGIKIRMEDFSGGAGTTDYLTIEKI